MYGKTLRRKRWLCGALRGEPDRSLLMVIHDAVFEEGGSQSVWYGGAR